MVYLVYKYVSNFFPVPWTTHPSPTAIGGHGDHRSGVRAGDHRNVLQRTHSNYPDYRVGDVRVLALNSACSTRMSKSPCNRLPRKYFDQSVFWSSKTSSVKYLSLVKAGARCVALWTAAPVLG